MYAASTASDGSPEEFDLPIDPGDSAFVSESDVERAIEVVVRGDLPDGGTVTITTFQGPCS